MAKKPSKPQAHLHLVRKKFVAAATPADDVKAHVLDFEHLDVIHAIQRDAVEDLKTPAKPGEPEKKPYWLRNRGKGSITGLLASEAGMVIGLIKDKKYLIGIAILSFPDNPAAKDWVGTFNFEDGEHSMGVHAFIVDPAFRGKGYGKLLMDLIKDEAVLKNRRVLKGIVATDNEESISSFKAAGFKPGEVKWMIREDVAGGGYYAQQWENHVTKKRVPKAHALEVERTPGDTRPAYLRDAHP